MSYKCDKCADTTLLRAAKQGKIVAVVPCPNHAKISDQTLKGLKSTGCKVVISVGS